MGSTRRFFLACACLFILGAMMQNMALKRRSESREGTDNAPARNRSNSSTSADSSPRSRSGRRVTQTPFLPFRGPPLPAVVGVVLVILLLLTMIYASFAEHRPLSDAQSSQQRTLASEAEKAPS